MHSIDIVLWALEVDGRIHTRQKIDPRSRYVRRHLIIFMKPRESKISNVCWVVSLTRLESTYKQWQCMGYHLDGLPRWELAISTATLPWYCQTPPLYTIMPRCSRTRGVSPHTGNIFSDIGESAGDAFGGLGGLFSDIGDVLGNGIDEVGDWAGDALSDGLDAARGLAEDIGELAGDGVDVAGELAEDIGELAGDGVDAAGELAENIGEGIGDGLDAAGELAEDAVDAVGDAVQGDEGEEGGANDVDMYAGAGPMDLDDEGPTGGGDFAKVGDVLWPATIMPPFESCTVA